MATLTGQTIASSYEQLLHVDTDGGGNTTTLVPVKDGDNGTTFCLQLSTTKAMIEGSGSKLFFSDEGGEYISGDGTTLTITAGAADVMKLDTNSRISLSNNDAGGTTNTIFGKLAGDDLASGAANNLFIGENAGHTNKLSDRNMAIGFGAMDLAYIDDTQDALTIDNIFIGFDAGGGDWATEASKYNVSIGNYSMDAIMNGALGNTVVGHGAASALTTGDNNVFIGRQSGAEGVSFATGNDCTLVGAFTDTSGVAGSNQIVIGYDCQGVADNTVTLGNNNVTDVYMASDSGATVHCAGVTNSGKIILGAETELTISSGAVTATSSFHKLDTEGDASSDDLDTVNGGVIGMILVLSTVDGGRDVVAKHGTGNMFLDGQADFTINHPRSKLTLIYRSGQWSELSRSTNIS